MRRGRGPRQGGRLTHPTTSGFSPRLTVLVLIWYGLILALVWSGAIKSTTSLVQGMQPARRLRGMADVDPEDGAAASAAAELRLMQRVQAGDADAFTVLFRRYNPRVYRQARRFLHDTAEAEDVAQEVFLTLYAKAHTFRGEAALSTWLYCLTANAALSRLRRRYRQREISLEGYLSYCKESGQPGLHSAAAPSQAFVEHLASAEAQRLLQEAIDQLRPMDRAAIVLSDLEGLADRDIAVALGLSISAVKARLHRARRLLRGRLRATLGHERS